MKMFYILAAAAVLSVASISPTLAATATDESCQAMFIKLDGNADGSLGGTEAAKVEEAMSKAQVKTRDAGIVTKAEFVEQCKKDMFEGM